MLLEDVDDILKPSTNMREAVNCSRIGANTNSKSSVSETHVDAMSNTEACGSRVLHQSETCGCIYDGNDSDHRSRKRKVNQYTITRVRSLDFTKNGNLSITSQNKPFNINEECSIQHVHEDANSNLSTDGQDTWSSPCICIDSTKENRPVVTVNNDSVVLDEPEYKEGSPVIRLSLRKPRHWNWKLTTSASSPAIILPAIQLLNEHGDLLLDTRKKSEPRTKLNKKRVDSNGNDRDLQSTESVSRFTEKLRPKHVEKKEVDYLNNEMKSGIIGKDVQDCETDEAGNLLLNEEKISIILGGENPRYKVEPSGTVHKNNKHHILDAKSRSIGKEKRLILDSEEDSKPDDFVVESVKASRSKGMSKKFNKSKAHLQSRCLLDRRHKREDSSTSTDSSPETRRRVRRWNKKTTGKRGDRLLEINGHPVSSYEETTEFLKNGSDVIHLKFLHRRHSTSNRKSRHDPASVSPATSRRSKRRHNCQRHDQSSLNIDSGMGSNVSRHSEKGLSGRRTQSSGNLCNGNKILAPNVGRILVPCSGGVGPKDRNKFCGSLPNHLDSNHSGDSEVPGSCCNGNNNNGEHTIPCSSTAQLKNKRNEVELRLHPLPPSCALDPAALHDQGYGSERSPEDEQPPSLPGMLELSTKYPFITKEATFEVCLLKGSRGLGLSVTGGVDSGEQWPGLIRIKRLFPHQPAWQSGQLSQGDILLVANGVPLVGLTNYQALEVLRKTPNNVILIVCRPPSDVFCIQAPSEPPPPPRRDPAHSISSSSHHILPLPPLQTEGPCGEFDIMLTKVNRSLGFTLRKEDESVLGHYVRALVREPALSDGRIKPGDKIVAVNDVDISPMSHEEAVMFLRQCGDQVKLRLYRDAAQTPVSALSPTEEVKVFKPKPLLRKEAMDMLSDLAVKKLSPCDSSSSSYSKLRRVSDGQSSSPCSSPRRRRLTKTPSPDIHAATLERLGQKYMVTSHVGNSDSSGEQSRTSTFTYPSMDSTKARGNASSFASTTGSGESIDMKPQRPNFLDLCGGSATPGASRKQKFTFSVAATGGDEWDSLAPTSESDELATNTTLGSVSQYYPTTSNSSEEFRTDGVDNSDPNYDGSLPTEPASMPPLTNLSSTSSTSTAFSYRNPAYQSAHPACYASNNQNSMKKGSEDITEHVSDQDIPGKLFNCQSGTGGEGSRGLLKWKGVVFTPESDDVEELGSSNITTCTDDSSSLLTTDRETEQGDQVFMVELTRGWNSRLGFSLRGDGRHTYISAIYADSVAAKDGRLQAGDQVLMVNDENVEEMSTAEVIDLLRKIRGTIGITILRKSGPNLQVS